MNVKNRIRWIDVVKGYGMILVVIGHCFNKGTLIHNWIFTFHMPLFFYLSGYCFNIKKYDSFKFLIKNKTQTLLLPYIKFLILGGMVSLLIPQWRRSFSVRQIIVDVWSAYPSLTNITSIWYLVAVFMCILIMWSVIGIAQRIKVRWLSIVFVIISALGGMALSYIKSKAMGGGQQDSVHTFLPGNRLPLTLDACMTAIPFFSLGIATQKKKIIFENKFVVPISLACMVCNIVVGVLLNERVNLHGCSLGNPIFYYLAAISGIYFSVGVCHFFSMKIDEKNTIMKWIAWFGKNSLVVLGVQSLVIHLLIYISNYLWDMNLVIYENVPISFELGYMFITLLLSSLAIVLNNKLPNKLKI